MTTSSALLNTNQMCATSVSMYSGCVQAGNTYITAYNTVSCPSGLYNSTLWAIVDVESDIYS